MMDCGECTLCCTLFIVEELDKPAGTACSNCSINCSIYESRPQSCKDLKCAYLQMTNVSVLMRPDNLGVVFEKLAPDLMFGTVNPRHNDFRHMNGQVAAFLKEGINVILSKNGSPIVHHLDDVSPESLLKRVHNMVNK